MAHYEAKFVTALLQGHRHLKQSLCKLRLPGNSTPCAFCKSKNRPCILYAIAGHTASEPPYSVLLVKRSNQQTNSQGPINIYLGRMRHKFICQQRIIHKNSAYPRLIASQQYNPTRYHVISNVMLIILQHKYTRQQRIRGKVIGRIASSILITSLHFSIDVILQASL